MVMANPTIPERFVATYNAIAQLAHADRYLGAFIFGSVARGTATAQSDFDVKVLIDRDNSCANINHPMIGGVKLDLTFVSLTPRRMMSDTSLQCHFAVSLAIVGDEHSPVTPDRRTACFAALYVLAKLARITPPAAGTATLKHAGKCWWWCRGRSGAVGDIQPIEKVVGGG